jgi:hypothetical protein
LKFQRCLLPPLPGRRRQAPLKRRSTSTKLHGTIFQKTVGHSAFISRTLHSSKCTKPSVGRLIWILSVKIIFDQKECFTFAESVRLLVTATSYDGITDRKQTTLLGILPNTRYSLRPDVSRNTSLIPKDRRSTAPDRFSGKKKASS